MPLSDLYPAKLQLPDPAGSLVRAGSSSSVARELGDNYGRYHDFLNAQLAAIGAFPKPDDQDALATWARIQDIAKTEFLLRNCHAIRKGRTADSAPVDDVPLQDPSGAFKLLSILVAPPAPASKEAP